MQTIKFYWNFTDQKWNLVEIGTIIPEGKYFKSYVVPAEVHFIYPRKSRLVRFAWKLHHIFRKIKPKKHKKINPDLSVFKNVDLGNKW